MLPLIKHWYVAMSFCGQLRQRDDQAHRLWPFCQLQSFSDRSVRLDVDLEVLQIAQNRRADLLVFDKERRSKLCNQEMAVEGRAVFDVGTSEVETAVALKSTWHTRVTTHANVQPSHLSKLRGQVSQTALTSDVCAQMSQLLRGRLPSQFEVMFNDWIRSLVWPVMPQLVDQVLVLWSESQLDVFG